DLVSAQRVVGGHLAVGAVNLVAVPGISVMVEDDLAKEVVVDRGETECHASIVVHRPTRRSAGARGGRRIGGMRDAAAPALAPPQPRFGPVFWLLSGQVVMFTGVAAIFPIAPLYVAAHGGG